VLGGGVGKLLNAFTLLLCHRLLAASKQPQLGWVSWLESENDNGRGMGTDT
jgi:hypothetical protein